MVNERLESALAWCEKNSIDSTRLKKFNRDQKRRRYNKRKANFLKKYRKVEGNHKGFKIEGL